MSRPIIRTKNLGKKYQIDRLRPIGSRSLREDIMALFGFNRETKRICEEFWALQELDLEFYAGQVVGIIGANGSGKSTLLKLLARVSVPSTGMIELFGRVGALLEVGTGFHPELTGRENVYLSGAILGMKRKEVDKEFDRIIDFSGVEEFLETPVKKYSSGMFLRLAFSVMAHLNNEILIVDEIIAVGDAEFQAKCLKKMQDIAKEGRTVIFVNHHADNIRLLCDRVLWLDKGRVVDDGAVNEVMQKYENLVLV